MAVLSAQPSKLCTYIFCKFCTVSIQRVQKVKGRHSWRKTWNLMIVLQVTMSICIPCIMEIININMSQVFCKVSASFMCSINKAHFRTVMQYFALSFSLIAWPCKYAAYRSDCDLHKNGSAFQSCFCTVHALQKPQLFCFQCMAWPLLLM